MLLFSCPVFLHVTLGHNCRLQAGPWAQSRRAPEGWTWRVGFGPCPNSNSQNVGPQKILKVWELQRPFFGSFIYDLWSFMMVWDLVFPCLFPLVKVTEASRAQELSHLAGNFEVTGNSSTTCRHESSLPPGNVDTTWCHDTTWCIYPLANT